MLPVIRRMIQKLTPYPISVCMQYQCLLQNVRDQGLRDEKNEMFIFINELFFRKHNVEIGHYGQTLFII
jgi:hypothetical protein